MAWRPSFEFAVIYAAIGALSPSPAVLAQKIVVDATPHTWSTNSAGTWSVMLVNRDRDHDQAVKIQFANAEIGEQSYFSGPVSRTTLGPAQYQWHSSGEMGHADPDGPASKSTVSGLEGRLYELP